VWFSAISEIVDFLAAMLALGMLDERHRPLPRGRNRRWPNVLG
jgi:hypothetical protein